MSPPSPVLDAHAPDRDAIVREVARRRTFAIISHPDAGRTTLTEQLLLALLGAMRAVPEIPVDAWRLARCSS